MYVYLDWLYNEFTQLRITGSMPSTRSSSLHVSSLQRDSSLKLVKGKALLPHIHIMWSAFGLTTLPCGSSTTRIGLFLKCHTSFINLMTAFSISEGWYTVYHGIEDCMLSNFSFIASLWTERSTIGTQTTSYWLSSLASWGLDSLYICSRIESSSFDMSRPEISNSTFFLLSTSRWTC